ncbi:MAG: hypothetical protein FGF50_06825, partial [Candidatus Brockarchaeota archaeon]|nr:hypothetical protein [Candidatus Brockarchaeota archaeon]
MSRRNLLSGFLNLARAWPLCLVNAAIAYFTIVGLLFLLAPDIAEFNVNGILTAKLVLTLTIVSVFLNVLLTLTYAASLFIVKHENVVEGLRRNCGKLVKGFAFLSISILACLAVIVLAGYNAISTTTLAQDAF